MITTAPLNKLSKNEVARIQDFWLYNAGFIKPIGDNVFTFSNGAELLFALSFREIDGIYEIYDVCTAEAHRREGIATKCLKYFLDMARFNGARILWLGAREESLVPFYEKVGFVAGPRTNVNYLGDTKHFFDFRWMTAVI